MKTVVTIIIAIIATVIGGGIALQKGLIPGFGPSNTTTIIKSYSDTGSAQQGADASENGSADSDSAQDKADDAGLDGASDLASCQTPRGDEIPHGEAILSFNQERALLDEGCESRTSICNNGEFLDGIEPYEYQACEYILPEVCEVNEFVFPNGTSRVFYEQGRLVDGSVECDSLERTCTNGEVSGEERFRYLSCFTEQQIAQQQAAPSSDNTDNDSTDSDDGDSDSADNDEIDDDDQNTGQEQPTQDPNSQNSDQNDVDQDDTDQDDSNDQDQAPSSQTTQTTTTPNRQPNCPAPFGGSVWQPGQTGMAYPSGTARHDETCQQVSIVCAYGSIRFGTADNPQEIAPDTLSQTCQVQPAVPCQTACGTIAHGDEVTTYQTDTIPFGSGRVCSDEQIVSTCDDGTLMPAGGDACECQIGDPVGCVAPNGTTVPHEGSITLFESPTVEATPGSDSSSCNSQWRQCINGDFYDRNSNRSPLTFEHESCEVVGG